MSPLVMNPYFTTSFVTLLSHKIEITVCGSHVVLNLLSDLLHKTSCVTDLTHVYSVELGDMTIIIKINYLIIL